MKSRMDKIIIFAISFILPVFICIALKFLFDYNSYDVCSFEGVEVSKTLLGTWATLLGFIVTAESILITMGGKEYIQAFKESRHYKTVLLTYFSTSFVLLSATIFSIVIICLNIWNTVLFYILIYLILSTFLLLFFCILFLFFMVYKSI